jgi:hypothetical protein
MSKTDAANDTMTDRATDTATDRVTYTATETATQAARSLTERARLMLAVTVLAFGIGMLPQAAHAATIDELVATQREAMRAEMAKKIADAKGEKPGAALPTANAFPSPLSAPVVVEAKEAKPPRKNPLDDIRVNGIYTDAHGVVTVDVSVGNSASFPLTKGRSVEGWSLADISEASVTFQRGKNGATKTIYMAQPTVSAVSPTVVATASSQQPMFPSSMSLPPPMAGMGGAAMGPTGPMGPTRPPVTQ